MEFISRIRSKLERETENDRQELEEILKNVDDTDRVKRLRSLASRIGATTITFTHDFDMRRFASEAELIQNIHQALQTKAMIAAVRTTSNYVIATVILALIALGGMVANFIMAFKVN